MLVPKERHLVWKTDVNQITRDTHEMTPELGLMREADAMRLTRGSGRRGGGDGFPDEVPTGVESEG